MKTTTEFESRLTRRVLGAGLVLTALASTCSAQWTVIYLHPQNAEYSMALGVRGDKQVGVAKTGGAERASQWNGSAAGWTDLNPDGASGSLARAIDGDRVGGAAVFGTYHASRWNGPLHLYEDLHPGVGVGSEIAGVQGDDQVGWVDMGKSDYRASMWTGAAAAWVNLNPTNATASQALGVSNGRQVGYADMSGQEHAIRWNGSADDWEDLNPNGASGSIARAIDGVQVAGAAVFGTYHAMLWDDNVGQTDLHPGGVDSDAYGVDGGEQVGRVDLGVIDVMTLNRASLWSGTPGSWVNLHSYLSPDYSQSVATGISHNGGVTYVVGYGYNDVMGRNEALMWMTPEPASLFGIAALLPWGAFRRRSRFRVR